jgi:hypothetical protein
VLWAIRDRGAQDRPGRPRNALYAYKLSGGRVGEVADGARFTAIPLPAPARDAEDIGRDGDGNLWIADIGDNECDRDDTALLRCASQTRPGPGRRPDQPPPGLDARARRPGPGPTNVEGVAFAWDSHDLNLLAENRDVFYVPAAAYER